MVGHFPTTFLRCGDVNQSHLVPWAIRGIYVGMAHDQVTAHFSVHSNTQYRFVHSGRVQFSENLDRSPETIVPPSYFIDREKEGVNDVELYDRILRGVKHLDMEDGIDYYMPNVMVSFGKNLSHRCPHPSPSEPWPLRHDP